MTILNKYREREGKGNQKCCEERNRDLGIVKYLTAKYYLSFHIFMEIIFPQFTQIY